MSETSAPLDCLIVGAGPAGLQAGYALGKKGLSYRILERGQIGQFFRQFPRHRTLISINKVNTGLSNPETKLRFDWNSLLNDEGKLFPDVSRRYFPNADDYVDYLDDFAGPMQEHITCGVEVAQISKADGVFTIRCTDDSTCLARTVIVATGVSRPWDPQIEGLDLAEQYYDFDTTPEGFRNKRVAILGKGNSAFETADALIEEAQAIHVISPNPVKLAWSTHFVGNLRAVNNNFLDTYQLKSQNAVIDAAVTKIERDGDGYLVHAKMTAAEGHDIVLHYDRVIACTGFRFDASIFDASIRPALRHFDKFPAMTAQWESEEAEGLFFVGTIMQCRDYKKTMSGFVHGFRHNVACLAEFVAARLTGQSYPHGHTALAQDVLSDLIIDRVSTGSGLFLQPGFLGDVVVMDGPAKGAHYRDVPVNWADSAPEFGDATTLRITMEFGDFGANAMHVKRAHTTDGSAPDPFIHPVVRLMRGDQVMAVTHLSDHLDSDWRATKDAGAGTVQRMTYTDVGQTLSGHEVAQRQLADFFANTRGLWGTQSDMVAAQ